MLVTVSELSDYMDRTLDNRQQDNAELVIAGVQAEVETELGRPVEVREFYEEHTVPENFHNMQMDSFFYDRSLDFSNSMHTMTSKPLMLSLDQTPVVSVSEVILTPFSDTLSPLTLVEGTHFIGHRWGLDIWTVARNDKISVTYTAGIVDNGYLKLLILRAAAREMQNMTDDVLGLKDFQNRQATIAEIGLTQNERASLRALKRKRI
jgi:hypothetical protein